MVYKALYVITINYKILYMVYKDLYVITINYMLSVINNKIFVCVYNIIVQSLKQYLMIIDANLR